MTKKMSERERIKERLYDIFIAYSNNYTFIQKQADYVIKLLEIERRKR